ncbi:MAG: universal stress protein [Mycobacteriales bacterium]
MTPVRVVVWIAEQTWEACIDAVATWAADDATVVLVHVTPSDVQGAAHHAFAGMLGRRGTDADPGDTVAHSAAASATGLLDAAEARLGRAAERDIRIGRVEREVVDAADGADLLVVARDGDDARLGPKSLGPHPRFVVDHAPCPVLLVWPGAAPAVGSIPPPPDRPPGKHHGPGHHDPHDREHGHHGRRRPPEPPAPQG